MNAIALFDLDGTLIDSAPDINAAANAMLQDVLLSPLSLADTRQFVGDGMERFIKRALTRQWWGEPEPSLLSRALSSMQFHYARECTAGRRVYEGVKETLTTLRARGVKMGCVTNKPRQFTRPVLDACLLSPFFGAVISGDTLSVKKPDPAPLREACRQLGGGANAWMIGDSQADAGAAMAGGYHFAVVAYGYHRNGHLPTANKIVYNFKEILEFI